MKFHSANEWNRVLCFMNLLSAEDIGKTFGIRRILHPVTLGINKGQKIGIVGLNGSGKSTLMRILCGLEPPTEGSVSRAKGIRIGFLTQDFDFNPESTAIEEVLRADHPAVKTAAAYRRLSLKAQSDDAVFQSAEFLELSRRMETDHAWDVEAKALTFLARLGIEYAHIRISDCSGGMKKRVSIARLLLEDPDFMVLDEPTNHLDVDASDWLESWLDKNVHSLLMVTHDRYFLDQVCNEIWELEFGKIHRYQGNYAAFLEQREERIAREATEVQKLENLYRKELEWIRKSPQARTTKSKSRITAFQKIETALSGRQKVASIYIEQIGAYAGSKIMELQNVSKAFGDNILLKKFDYTFRRRERLGIVGPNGVGKTTLLNLIAGLENPDTGQVVAGENTRIGYFRQELAPVPDNLKVLDAISSIAEKIELPRQRTVTASQLLSMFLFPPAVQHDFVYKLSGGERKRLALVQILMANPNFLIFDEPTNDLDINTLNVLEAFLQEFGGVVVVVSHDRYFMDKITENLLVLEGQGQTMEFPGNYSDFRIWKEQRQLNAKKEKEKESAPPVQPREEEKQVQTNNAKRTFKEQKHFEALNQQMEGLEAEKANLQEKMNLEQDYQRIQEMADRLQVIEQNLDAISDEWLQLAEKEPYGA